MSRRFTVMLLVGAFYFLVGRAFAAPTTRVYAWRLAAWLVSGVAYAAHFTYEHFQLRSAPRTTAMHVAGSVAVGALALAVAGLVHSLFGTAPFRLAWLVALIVFPAATGLPAFLGALVAGLALRRLSPSASAP